MSVCSEDLCVCVCVCFCCVSGMVFICLVIEYFVGF